jgi:hypothetical protein
MSREHGATALPLGGFCETRKHRREGRHGATQTQPLLVARRSTCVQRVSPPLEYLAARSGWRCGSWGLRCVGAKTDGDTQIDEALAAYCRLRVFDASSARAISYPVESSCPALWVSSFPSNHCLFFFLLMLALLKKPRTLFSVLHCHLPDQSTCGRNHRAR